MQLSVIKSSVIFASCIFLYTDSSPPKPASSFGAYEILHMADYVPKNILLTGGAGFIASHVVARLMKYHPEYKVHISRYTVREDCVLSQCSVLQA